jgi:heme-degrading monooxygenase HmoA
MKLKPNSVAEFTQRLEKDVIPMLRRQKGFQDEIALVVPDGTKVLAISLWDNAESASAYNSGAYSEVVSILSKVVEGTPHVETYDVSNSTFHKISATVPASVFLVTGAGFGPPSLFCGRPTSSKEEGTHTWQDE